MDDPYVESEQYYTRYQARKLRGKTIRTEDGEVYRVIGITALGEGYVLLIDKMYPAEQAALYKKVGMKAFLFKGNYEVISDERTIH